MPTELTNILGSASNPVVRLTRRNLRPGVAQSSKKLVDKRGCDACPSKGKRKIFGAIRGKPILVIGMRPALHEEQQGLPFVGRSGKLLWDRANRLRAFSREDCDVDNVVRCRGTEKTPTGTREIPPTKQELFCCSLHTEAQLAKASPKVILLLGEVAQKQYLGKAYKAGRVFYWDEKLNCRIICTYHPSYMLRHPPVSAWKIFDRALRLVRHTLEYPGRLGYLRAQDYQELVTSAEIGAFFREAAAAKTEVVFDVEDGWADAEKTRRMILMIGFCYKRGQVRVIFLDHPDCKTPSGKKWALVKAFLESDTPKSAWNGASDCRKLWCLKQIRVRHFWADAMLAEYLAYPERKDYRLATAAERRFPRFVGWKEVVDPYLGLDASDFSKVPGRKLFWRNAGDCDLPKRCLHKTLTDKNRALVRLYTDASFTALDMGERGILVDQEHLKRLLSIYEPLEKKLDREIALVSGKPDFKVTDDNIRWLLTEKLHLHLTAKTKAGEDGKKSGFKAFAVGKEVLKEITPLHPVVMKIRQRRFVEKLRGTHLIGFQRCAAMNDGRVKTRFKLTGASTGRTSSGGDKKSKHQEEVHLVNLQNIHGDPSAQNILVSTLRWRDLAKACARMGKHEAQK